MRQLVHQSGPAELKKHAFFQEPPQEVAYHLGHKAVW